MNAVGLLSWSSAPATASNFEKLSALYVKSGIEIKSVFRAVGTAQAAFYSSERTMPKLVLVTGASRGIGKAVADRFKNNPAYEVVTVARTGDVTEHGDLTDINFRNYLIGNYTPDIFVNNAGVSSPNFIETFELNVMAMCHLLVEFWKKMDTGNIINVSSTAANKSGWQGMSDRQVNYLASKKALSSISKDLAISKRKLVKVTSLEPHDVNTTCGGRFMKDIDYNRAEEDIDYFAPMPAEYVAEVIEWIVNQPKFVAITELEISNMCRASK